jgi:hypothetical protein
VNDESRAEKSLLRNDTPAMQKNRAGNKKQKSWMSFVQYVNTIANTLFAC